MENNNLVWIPYLIFALVLLGFVGVILYWINEKRKGHSILSDEPHMTSKQLVRDYRLRKEAEAKRLAKAQRKAKKKKTK